MRDALRLLVELAMLLELELELELEVVLLDAELVGALEFELDGLLAVDAALLANELALLVDVVLLEEVTEVLDAELLAGGGEPMVTPPPPPPPPQDASIRVMATERSGEKVLMVWRMGFVSRSVVGLIVAVTIVSRQYACLSGGFSSVSVLRGGCWPLRAPTITGPAATMRGHLAGFCCGVAFFRFSCAQCGYYAATSAEIRSKRLRCRHIRHYRNHSCLQGV